MNTLLGQRTQRIIHKAMSSYSAQAGEARAGQHHAEMSALARTGMAGMQVAVVVDLQRGGGERGLQAIVDLGGGHHGRVLSRCRQA